MPKLDSQDSTLTTDQGFEFYSVNLKLKIKCSLPFFSQPWFAFVLLLCRVSNFSLLQFFVLNWCLLYFSCSNHFSTIFTPIVFRVLYSVEKVLLAVWKHTFVVIEATIQLFKRNGKLNQKLHQGTARHLLWKKSHSYLVELLLLLIWQAELVCCLFYGLFSRSRYLVSLSILSVVNRWRYEFQKWHALYCW